MLQTCHNSTINWHLFFNKPEQSTHLLSIQVTLQKYHFSVGRTTTLLLARIFKLLTRSSRPLINSITRPNGQYPLGLFSSTMRTKSPTQTLGRVRCHFCWDCSLGKYSATQRLQNALTMLWTWRHCFLYLSLSWNTPIGKDILLPSMSKRFGVKGVSSFTSLLNFVSGRPFTTFSTSQKNVWRESSVNLAFLWRIAVNTLRMVWISLSHTPPWCDARGVLISIQC